ncbi:MAG: hypothetical protein ACK4WH_07220 [Phycisphaerales bacterium]
MTTFARKTAAVWLEPDQLGLVADVVRSLELRVVAAGTPSLGRSAELAADLGSSGVRPVVLDDLRQALAGAEADLFLLASTDGFSRGRALTGGESLAGFGADDAAVLVARLGRGGQVVSFDPLPASILDQSAHPADAALTEAERAGVVIGQQSAPPASPSGGATDSRGSPWAAFVPLLRTGSSMQSAAEVLALAGEPHTVAVECFSGVGEGGLGARLLDGAELATHLLGEPDSVEASYVWPGRGRVVHPLPGDSLYGLRGAMTVDLRYGDGRAASLVCADASVGAGRWSRRVTIIGERGRVRIGDAGFEFVSADGRAVDRSRGWADEAEGVKASAVFAGAIHRLIDPHAGGVRDLPVDWARTLSVTGAALLSARTGEPESPQTIRRMASTL